MTTDLVPPPLIHCCVPALLRLLSRWAEHGDGGRALVPEASHAGHVLALYLATRGDLVVVGASLLCCVYASGWLQAAPSCT